MAIFNLSVGPSGSLYEKGIFTFKSLRFITNQRIGIGEISILLHHPLPLFFITSKLLKILFCEEKNGYSYDTYLKMGGI